MITGWGEEVNRSWDRVEPKQQLKFSSFVCPWTLCAEEDPGSPEEEGTVKLDDLRQ